MRGRAIPGIAARKVRKTDGGLFGYDAAAVSPAVMVMCFIPHGSALPLSE